MIPAEVHTFGVSSILGAVIKLWSKRIEHDRLRFEQALRREEFKEASRIRAASVGGPWIRRLIVSAILFAVFLAPFIIAARYPDVPVYYAYTEEKGMAPQTLLASITSRLFL